MVGLAKARSNYIAVETKSINKDSPAYVPILFSFSGSPVKPALIKMIEIPSNVNRQEAMGQFHQKRGGRGCN